MGEVTITVMEYKKLLEAKIRINIFAEAVNHSSYSMGREECANYLGFELEEKEED